MLQDNLEDSQVAEHLLHASSHVHVENVPLPVLYSHEDTVLVSEVGHYPAWVTPAAGWAKQHPHSGVVWGIKLDCVCLCWLVKVVT